MATTPPPFDENVFEDVHRLSIDTEIDQLLAEFQPANTTDDEKMTDVQINQTHAASTSWTNPAPGTMTITIHTPDDHQKKKSRLEEILRLTRLNPGKSFSSSEELDSLVNWFFLQLYPNISRAVDAYIDSIEPYYELTDHEGVNKVLAHSVASGAYPDSMLRLILGPVPHFRNCGFRLGEVPLPTDQNVDLLVHPIAFFNNIDQNTVYSSLGEKNFFIVSKHQHMTKSPYLFVINERLYYKVTGRVVKPNQLVLLADKKNYVCPHCYAIHNKHPLAEVVKHIETCNARSLMNHCGACDEYIGDYKDHIFTIRHYQRSRSAICMNDRNLVVRQYPDWTDVVAVHHELVFPSHTDQYDQFRPPTRETTERLVRSLIEDPSFLERMRTVQSHYLLPANNNRNKLLPCFLCDKTLSSTWPVELSFLLPTYPLVTTCETCGQCNARAISSAIRVDKSISSIENFNHGRDAFALHHVKVQNISIRSGEKQEREFLSQKKNYHRTVVPYYCPQHKVYPYASGLNIRNQEHRYYHHPSGEDRRALKAVSYRQRIISYQLKMMVQPTDFGSRICLPHRDRKSVV